MEVQNSVEPSRVKNIKTFLSGKGIDCWAAIFSISYIVAMVVLVIFKRDNLLTLGLNEVGDFLAGTFGPLGFLWLVVGYYQQRKEFQASLREMQNQSETDRTRLADDQRLQAERHLQYRRSLLPIFHIECSDAGCGEATSRATFKVTNSGAKVRSVIFDVAMKGQHGRQERFSIFDADEIKEFSAEWLCNDRDDRVVVEISYMSQDFESGVVRFVGGFNIFKGITTLGLNEFNP
ncbi:hypothetical protein [Pseudomonas graminis]